MRFDWDPEKARSNLAKHNVSFEFASTAFEDANAVSIHDRVVDGEERWRTVARAAGGVTILFVAHTYLDDEGEIFVRLIMARRASRQERNAYERGDEGFFR
jgi:uncharacterized DUF497 family protein